MPGSGAAGPSPRILAPLRSIGGGYVRSNRTSWIFRWIAPAVAERNQTLCVYGRPGQAGASPLPARNTVRRSPPALRTPAGHAQVSGPYVRAGKWTTCRSRSASTSVADRSTRPRALRESTLDRTTAATAIGGGAPRPDHRVGRGVCCRRRIPDRAASDWPPTTRARGSPERRAPGPTRAGRWYRPLRQSGLFGCGARPPTAPQQHVDSAAWRSC